VTVAVWGLVGALLVLAAVIARVGWIWATTSHLDRPLAPDEIRAVIEDPWFRWPVLERNPDDDEAVS